MCNVFLLVVVTGVVVVEGAVVVVVDGVVVVVVVGVVVVVVVVVVEHIPVGVHFQRQSSLAHSLQGICVKCKHLLTK